MITIIADEGKDKIGEQLYNALLTKGAKAEYIPLENVQVHPCVNCGTCSKKTPGRCATRDDGDWIYPKVAAAEAVVIVSPVVFGGYSVKAKRVIDKFGLLMDSHYFVRDGELVKGGLRGRRFRYYAVGIGAETREEAKAFEKLIHETNVIVQGTGRAFLAGSPTDSDLIEKIVEEVTCA